MALSKNLYSQNSDYNADELRQLATSVIPTSGGVFGGRDMAVTINGTNVQVAAGRCAMSSTRATNAPRFILHNTATYNTRTTGGTTASFAFPGNGNSRVDVVYALINDKGLDGVGSDTQDLIFQIGNQVVGTGAVAPTLYQANAYYVLAHIYSQDTATYVIRDKRTLAAGVGGINAGLNANRPTSGAWEGYPFYETDNDKLLLWTGSGTTGWQPPWNMPWGILAVAPITADTPGYANGATITGWTTSSLTYPSNRRIRATLTCVGTATVSQNSPGVSGFASLLLKEGATQRGGFTLARCTGTQTVFSDHVTNSITWVSTAGSYSCSVYVQTDITGGAVTVYANAAYPAQFIIEDVGPAGAPA